MAIYGSRNKLEPFWLFMAPEIAISWQIMAPETAPFWLFLGPAEINPVVQFMGAKIAVIWLYLVK